MIHLFWVLRLFWVISFGFTLLVRLSLVLRFYYYYSDLPSSSNSSNYVLLSLVVSFVVSIFVLLEFLNLLYHSFRSTTVSYTRDGDHGSRIIVLVMLFQHVIRDLKNSFLGYIGADKEWKVRCYNFLWIWRWLLVWGIYTFLYKSRVVVTLVAVVINLVWLIFTGLLAF